MKTPQHHFRTLEAIMQRHAMALEEEIRALQVADQTQQWPTAWKQLYNWYFANCFAQQKVFRNWAADAAAWNLLPKRQYPNRGNRQPQLESEIPESKIPESEIIDLNTSSPSQDFDYP
jgi:hypothetical protein